MNSIVKFENQEFELVTVDGEPMMTAAQIGRALGTDFQNGSATDGQNVRRSDRQNVGACDVAKIYRRHSEEFTPEMTCIIQQGRTQVRVFNREGAWLIGMFARTPKAAAFRKWVITALAAHVDGIAAAEAEPRALPPLDDLTEEQIAEDIAKLQLAACMAIRRRWFMELSAELEQAKKTIKEQNETLRRIGAMLPAK